MLLPNMYSVYRKVLSVHITRIVQSYCYDCKVQLVLGADDHPYFLVEDERFGMEGQPSICIMNCIVQMLILFNIYEFWDGICVHHNNIVFQSVQNNVEMLESLVRYNWMGKINNWYVYSLNDLPIYEVNDEKVDRLLLLLIIDPLAFISRMRHRIGVSSLKVRQFFDVIEAGICDIMQRYVVKYFLVNQLCGNEIVNDVIFLIVDSWVQLEICGLEKLKV